MSHKEQFQAWRCESVEEGEQTEARPLRGHYQKRGIRSQRHLSWIHTMMFCIDDGADDIHRLIQTKVTVDDHIIERLHTIKFLACGRNTDRKRIGGLGLARLKA